MNKIQVHFQYRRARRFQWAVVDSPARAKSVRAARSKRCFLPALDRPRSGAPLEAEALSCSRASGLQSQVKTTKQK